MRYHDKLQRIESFAVFDASLRLCRMSINGPIWSSGGVPSPGSRPRRRVRLQQYRHEQQRVNPLDGGVRFVGQVGVQANAAWRTSSSKLVHQPGIPPL